MTKRVFSTVVVAAVLAAACGGGGGVAADGSDPGSTQVAPPPEQEAPPDLAANSYVDNLLAKERDGEWTRGEGLIATLELVTEDSAVADVLRYPELVTYELTGIVGMARDYIETGPDDAARERIAELLDRIFFSNERLEAMAGIGPETASLVDEATLVVFQDAQHDCRLFFPNHPMEGVGVCLLVETLHVLDVPGDGPYRVFRPGPNMPDGGWTDAHVTLAREAMGETVVRFSELEGIPDLTLPPVNLVFSVADAGYAAADPVAGQPCGVVMFTAMQKFTPVSFKQVVAHELAHCFQTENFVSQNEVDYEYIRWREEGVAEYLGNLVYPPNDLEWDQERMQKLAAAELKTTLFDRAYTNFMFFMYLAGRGGDPLVFDVVRALPTSNGHEAQKAALQAYPGMVEWHHDFATTVTDERLADTGGSFGKYAMTEVNEPTTVITAPGTVVQGVIQPFGLVRRHLVVESGKQACLQWDDAELFVEQRANPSGEWQALPVLLPASVDDSGDVDLVVTAKTARPFVLQVLSVHNLDEDTDGELLGEWVVINSSMRRKVEYIAPVQRVSSIGGAINVAFRGDGTVELAYNGFTVSGSSTVRLERGAFSADYSQDWESVTAAAGEDTYELKGDYVFYGHLFESDILRGTQTVRTSASGVFFGIDAGDYEIDVDMPASTEDESPATGWAFLGAANQVRFRCGGNILLLDDIALRRVR